MRIYIIGNDGITLCRKAPATVNDGEIAVASNEELHAARLSGKRLLALWAGVVVERGQRGCRRAPGRGGRSVRCANVARISLGPARRTFCKSRGECPASTHRTTQAPRRRESGNRQRRLRPRAETV